MDPPVKFLVSCLASDFCAFISVTINVLLCMNSGIIYP